MGAGPFEQARGDGMNAQLQYDAAEALAVDEIPVIDFAPFLTGTPQDRAAVAAEIDRACRTIGFFYLTNHGVPETLRQSVLAEARDFFARSFDEKMACAPILDGQWCGYLPARGAAEGTKPGGSLTEEGRKAKTVSGGSLEQFNMMRVRLADDPHYANPDPIYQNNRWPEGAPGFVETMIVNQRALLSLAGELMRAFAIALGLEEEHFVRLHRSPLATFGLNFYPQPRPGAGDVGVGAHCDASSFTVLLQDEVGGLEVQTRDGRWISAPVVPGAYVINIGDTMMAWTNGQFVSTFHRVVSRKPQDRFSATMFVNPDREVVVEPVAALVGQGQQALYEPFLNDDYMRGFFVKFYGSMFK